MYSMRLVSLGQACEVGFQIRLHTSKTDSDFFDWLITPFDSLMISLDNRFSGLLNSDDLYLQEDRNFVNNRVTGIQYGHVFARNANHDIPDNFADDLSRVKSKFSYLKRKFLSYAETESPICFVRRNINNIQAEALNAKFVTMFPTLNFTICCVNSSDAGISTLDSDRFIDLRIVDSGPDGLGDSESWAKALVGAGLSDKPFQKTKDEIVIPFH